MVFGFHEAGLFYEEVILMTHRRHAGLWVPSRPAAVTQTWLFEVQDTSNSQSQAGSMVARGARLAEGAGGRARAAVPVQVGYRRSRPFPSSSSISSCPWFFLGVSSPCTPSSPGQGDMPSTPETVLQIKFCGVDFRMFPSVCKRFTWFKEQLQNRNKSSCN